ncbi:hypothetical protein H4V95_001223 [Arthrobacter sp. CAN_C5]|nr:hypothetical protein [Arthrobacter sp. CAN_C5]
MSHWPQLTLTRRGAAIYQSNSRLAAATELRHQIGVLHPMGPKDLRSVVKDFSLRDGRSGSLSCVGLAAGRHEVAAQRRTRYNSLLLAGRGY